MCYEWGIVPILIDGHNLIGRLPAISLADADDEEKLVRLLQSYRARTGKAITVVFDPGPAPTLPHTRQVGGVSVVFAPPGSSADAVIARRVKKNRNPRGLLVVTSDRELAGTVAAYGARTMPAEEFAQNLDRAAAEGPSKREAPLSDDEVEMWLALFEDNDRDSMGDAG